MEASVEEVLKKELEAHYAANPTHRPSCCGELAAITKRYADGRREYLKSLAETEHNQVAVMFLELTGRRYWTTTHWPSATTQEYVKGKEV